MSIDPGWYKDPAEPTTQRYWDGEGWVGKPLPADAEPPAGPPPAEPEPTPGTTESPGTGAGGPTAGTPPVGAPGQPPVGGEPPPGQPPAAGPGHPGPGGAHPGPGGGYPVPGGHPGPGGPHPGAGYPGPYPVPPGWPGYQPKPPPRPHGLKLAPLGSRLLARVIDIGVVFLLNAVVNGWFVWQYAQEMSPAFAEAWRRVLAGEQTTEPLPQGDQAQGLLMVILLLAAALWFAYEVPAVGNTGQTLGKRVAGIKVVSMEADDQLGFGRSFRRWIRMGLPVLLWYCCVGFVLQLIDTLYLLFDRPLHQALHDKSARTVVVQVAPKPATPPAGDAAPAADRTDPPRTDPPGGSV